MGHCAKCTTHCSVLLCKTGLHQACITVNKPVKNSSSYRCAVTQHRCTATLFRAKCTPHCSVLLYKTGLQQACITALTSMKLCSSCRCAMTQHQCTATLFRTKCSLHVWAKCIPHCSVVLCKSGSQQACVTATPPMEICSSYRCAWSGHCNTVQGKMQCPLISAALQDWLAADSMIHLRRYPLSTGLQEGPNPSALQNCSGQTTMPTAALQDWLAACLYHCRYTYEGLLFHAGVQGPNTNALQHCSGQNAVPTDQC